jgi:hypothetical protein
MSESNRQTDPLDTWLSDLEPGYLEATEALFIKAEAEDQEQALCELNEAIDRITAEVDRLEGHSTTQHHSWPMEDGWVHILLSPTQERGQPREVSVHGRTHYLQVTVNEETRVAGDEWTRINKDYFVDFPCGSVATYEGRAIVQDGYWRAQGACPPLINQDDSEHGPSRYWFPGYDPNLPSPLSFDMTAEEVRTLCEKANELSKILGRLGPATLDDKREYA